MSEVSIADRIKNAIIENGGYQQISELTGISKSTLSRTASGQTEPKLKDAIAIAKATGVTLNYLAYGMLTEDEEAATLQTSQVMNFMVEAMKKVTELQINVEKELEELREVKRGSYNDVQAFKKEMFNMSPQEIVESDRISNQQKLKLIQEHFANKTPAKNKRLDHMLEATVAPEDEPNDFKSDLDEIKKALAALSQEKSK